jgi:glutamate synthase (ferredoxin)
MTGGTVVVLGKTGRNFAAGMSGGVAYVLDDLGDFRSSCNLAMVQLESIENSDQSKLRLRSLIESHFKYTESQKARQILDRWEYFLPRFIQVIPTEYKNALRQGAIYV